MYDVLISKLANLRSMASWRLPKPDVETLDEVIGVLGVLNRAEALYTAPKAVPLTKTQKAELVANWFAEEWAQEKALGVLDDYETMQHIGTQATVEKGKP